MDIEKLKGSWNRYTSKFSDKAHEEKELEAILMKKSQDSLRKLRRNFIIEAGLNILIAPVIVYLIIKSSLFGEPFDWIFSGIVTLLMLVFLGYMYDSYKRIYQYEDTGTPLKEKLKNQVARLEKFIKDYYLFVYAGYFLGLFFGFSSSIPREAVSMSIELGVAILVGLLGLFFLVRPLSKKYLKKLYGAHVESLKACLAELMEINNENEVT